jgi:hypothetical protein
LHKRRKHPEKKKNENSLYNIKLGVMLELYNYDVPFHPIHPKLGGMKKMD